MGSHQHEPRRAGAIDLPPQAGQARRVPWRWGQVRQAIEQRGRALEQEAPRSAPTVPGLRVPKLAHRRPQGRQVPWPFRIHRHGHVVAQPRQPPQQRLSARLQLPPIDPLHRRRRDAAAALLRHPVGQMAGAVAEEAVAGELALVHGSAVQPMHPVDGGAAPLQEGGHEQGGVERTELRGDRLHLQRIVAAQGGIAPAHHQPRRPPFRQGGPQDPADLPHPLPRLWGRQGAGVGQQEQQR